MIEVPVPKEVRARKMNAGFELDMICAVWLECDIQVFLEEPRPFSTEWTEAYRLFEALRANITYSDPNTGKAQCYVPARKKHRSVRTTAP